MKRSCLVLAILAACALFIPAEWLNLRDGYRSSVREPAVQVLADNETGVTLQIGVWGADYRTRDFSGQPFAVLDLPEAGRNATLGHPSLPVVRRWVEVPAGASVSVQADVLTAGTFSLGALGIREEILPVQLPVEKTPGAERNTPFQLDQRVYATDAFYPAEVASCSAPMVVRGHHLVMVEFFPIRYNPVSRELLCVNEAVVRVRTEGGSRSYSKAEAALRFAPAFEPLLASRVVNYQTPSATSAVLSASSFDGILYIVGNAYSSNANLTSYIEKRRAEGFRVEVVPMSAIGSTANQVRDYVRSQYLSWTNPGLSYVVLVGDTPDIPAYMGSGGGNSQATDRYYACVDPENYSADILAPDLIVSRICVASNTELNNYLVKAMRYVNASFTDVSWMKRLCFIGTDDSGNYQTAEGTHNYVINTYTAAKGYAGSFPSDPQSGGDKLYAITYSADTADCLAAINKGRTVINYSGHGGTTSWAGPSFTVTNIRNITHPDAIPFSIGNACVTGSYNGTSKCFAEQWIVEPTGAIVYWGASNNSYWDEDDILERRMWDGLFAQHLDRIGDHCAYAMAQMIQHFGTSSSSYYYAEIYNLFGDVTLNLYSDLCQDFAPSFPGTIPIGANSVSFQVATAKANVANAMVCLTGDGNVRQTGLTNSGGDLTLSLNPVPTTPGELAVVITAPNKRRYEGVIMVTAASGPFLTKSSHEITTNGATPTQPMPGRRIVMPVTLKNVGSENASGITTTLSSSSSLVSIGQASASFPDLSIGQSARSTTHFEFTISPSAQNGDTIPLAIAWAAGTGSGTINISLQVVSPKIELVSFSVDDSGAGCDADGIADIGESAVFTLKVKNDGGCNASSVRVSLASLGCTAPNSAALGTLAPGASADAQVTLIPGKTLECPKPNAVLTATIRCSELSTPPQVVFQSLLNADLVQGQVVCQRKNCNGEDTYGDLNRDFVADGLDALLYGAFMEGNLDGLTCPWQYADLNQDGEVDSLDLVILYHYMVGNISKLPL